MDLVTRNVGDLSADERHVYENVLGQPLRDDQCVIVRLVDADARRSTPVAGNGSDELPDWCTIWADLSDEAIVDLESAILQRSESRPT